MLTENIQRTKNHIAKAIQSRTISILISLALLFFIMIYALLVFYSMYRSCVFGFHDVTLINDWLTNAVFEGKPFWITDYGINHIIIHFTPSLLIFAPLYLLFESQFILIAVEIVSFFFGAFILLIILNMFLDRLKLIRLPIMRFLVLLFFVCIVTLNSYSKITLASAHFETIYVLLASFVFYFLVG